MHKKIPLEEIIGSEDEIDRSLSPEDVLFVKELEEQTQRVLASLTPTEKQVLAMRFGIKEEDENISIEVAPNPLRKIAETHQRLHEVRKRSLRRFKKLETSS